MALEAADRRQVTSRRDFTAAGLKAAALVAPAALGLKVARPEALVLKAASAAAGLKAALVVVLAAAVTAERSVVVVTAALVALAAVKAVPVVAVKAAAVAKATAKKSHRCSEFIKLGASA